MTTTDLVVGKTALFNHCEMGWIDIEITRKFPKPLDMFYTGLLKKVYMKDVKISRSATLAMSLLASGKAVEVFVQPSELIKYK